MTYDIMTIHVYIYIIPSHNNNYVAVSGLRFWWWGKYDI